MIVRCCLEQIIGVARVAHLLLVKLVVGLHEQALVMAARCQLSMFVVAEIVDAPNYQS